MKSKTKKNKGITLISLIVTIIVLTILASMAVYSGINAVNSSKLTAFTAEMKIMQTNVNDLYEKYKDGDEGVLSLGQSISGNTQAEKALSAAGIAQEEKADFRYYTNQDIVNLRIEGIKEREFLVDVKGRKVVSYEGFEYNGTVYYTLDQLPKGLYNVEYEDIDTSELKFDVKMSREQGNYRITVSNIQYSGYINKWEVRYQKEGETDWKISKDLSFIVEDKGPYNIKIGNNDIESASQIVAYDPKLVRKWTNKIDGNGDEEFLDVKETSDGGYIAVGYTTSTNINGLENKGGEDAIIVKYDANGNEQWKKSVGGSKDDRYNGVIEITNGTYIAVGTIYSTDVLDKNNVNIGHGYDLTFEFVGTTYMEASEGIIGRYDSAGNEISLKVTGEATDKYTTEQYREEGGTYYEEFDILEYSVANIIIYGINKTRDGNFILTGQKNVGVPSSFMDSGDAHAYLVIKYDEEGNKISINKLDMMHGTSYSIGIKEDLNGNYFDYGFSNDILNKELLRQKGIKISSDVLDVVEQLLLYDDGSYISLLYTSYQSFPDIEFRAISNGSNLGDTLNWEKDQADLENRIIKQISKSSENDFVAICEKDNNCKLSKFSVEDATIIEEYDIPTYENIYAIEEKEEFILLGTPTNEEGITIEGNSGAVIAKYAIE